VGKAYFGPVEEIRHVIWLFDVGKAYFGPA
jgi:hypothetical protein